MRRWSRRWPIRRCRSASPTLGMEIPPRDQQTPEALARLPEGRNRELVAGHQGRQHQADNDNERTTEPRRRHDTKTGRAASSRSFAIDRGCARANLSVASDHARGAARARRLDRRDRPHHGRRRCGRISASRSSSRTRPAPAAPSASIRVARAAPDGYTVQIGQWGTNVASGAIYPLCRSIS